MDIHFVAREEIDKVKWNSCVHYAPNGNVFGYIWFLDQVAKDWDALVEGDYESVLPLVWRKTWWGGKELYQPALMRELGIYSINVLSPKRIHAFLDAIPPEYRSVTLVFNEQITQLNPRGYQLEERTNHQILLAQPYDQIKAAFSPQLLARLEKAEDDGIVPTTSLKPEKIAEFYRKYARDRRSLDRNFHALQRIMYNILHRGWGFASGGLDENGDLLAANFFIYSHKKVMSLLPLESPAGRERGALAFLTDLLIKSHADRPMILDFNTEKEDPLALSFGAQANIYYELRKEKKWLGVV